jgi:hypothetical protein
MAYIYLLNLYDEIEKRLTALETNGDQDLFKTGRQDLLREFKQYLTDNMNDKLPKRIRKRLSGQN